VTLILAACLLYFLAAGLLVLPYPGIENDEALFAGGIYAPELMAGSIRLFGHRVALMLMPYVGALKAWLYAPIFALWHPSAWSLRVPVLLTGAAAVWLFFCYLDRIAGRRAALIGAVLLATDTSFLLTTCFDWGPVALQQVLLLGGLVFILDYYRSRSQQRLAAGFFLFGLAFWDKAVFVWMFSGLVVAAAILFAGPIRRLATPRRSTIAAAAFLAGASPLLLYNFQHSLATFRGKQYSFRDFDRKLAVLRYTLRGDVMRGFLVDDHPGALPAGPRNAVEAASLRLSDAAGHPRTGWLPYALLLAVALVPFLRPGGQRRAVLFFALAFLVSWFEMLVTVNAGGSAHHTILLWPHVHAFVAVALAGGLRRLGKGALLVTVVVVGLVAGSNVLVMNEYLAGLIRFGPGRMWTDAVYPLAEVLKKRQPPIIYAADWGMGDTLRMLLEGKTPVAGAVEPFNRRQLDKFETEQVRKRLAEPGALFVSFVSGKETFPQARRLVLRCAEQAGYRRELLEVVRDRRGRPVFEIARYEAATPAPGGNRITRPPRK